MKLKAALLIAVSMLTGAALATVVFLAVGAPGATPAPDASSQAPSESPLSSQPSDSLIDRDFGSEGLDSNVADDETTASEEKKEEPKAEKGADASKAPDSSKGSTPKKSEPAKKDDPKKKDDGKKDEPKKDPIKVVTDVNGAMLALVNQVRAENGAAPLTLNSELIAAASKQAYYQAENKKMTHEGHGGLEARLGHVGYCYSAAGENVEVGYNAVNGVHNGWVNSSGHFVNMIDPAFTEMGVAYATNGDRYWAQVFGAPC